jgi:hypothetical protein
VTIEAEETLLSKIVASEWLTKTQRLKTGLAGVVVICKL